MRHHTSVLFYLLIPITIFAQNNSLNYYKDFDKIVGTISNDLSQGIRFVDAYNRSYSKNDFRFFKSDAYTLGYLIYNDEPFYDCNIKYDVLEDQIIFRDNTEKSNFEIILNALHIDSFTIYGNKFVKLPRQVSKFSFYNNGFFEHLYKGQSFNVFLKHQKIKKKRLSDKTVLYEFLISENLVLEYKSEFYQLNSKNDIINILPEKKAIIKSFYTQNKVLRSQNFKGFMVALFRHLEPLNN